MPADPALPRTLAADLRALLAQLKRRLREQADTGDLTPTQLAAFLRLEQDGPLTTSTLAREEGVRSQSMGATVAALQAAGLVEGAPDPADRRQTLLAVTPEARAWLSAGRAARQDWLTRRLTHELDDDERARLAEALALLRRVVDA